MYVPAIASIDNRDDDTPEVTTVDIDTGTLETAASFDADGGAYNFMDDASILNNVEISNLGDGSGSGHAVCGSGCVWVGVGPC